MGFYSTIPSSDLNNRLNALKAKGKIKDYRFFDNKLVEHYLMRIGFSKLLMRYLPESYKKVKPTHLIVDEFIPLECAHCSKELLKSLNHKYYQAIICKVISREDDYLKVIDLY
ncbi:hypothetical protein OMCYN_01757 [cyanobiont of Ornithocercus magnificus]|nr:hypothetical protein OMCYN_01757 [cyanobiont of Ornithocercus magnificus]